MHKKKFHSHNFKNKNKHEGKKKFEGKNKTSKSANFKKKGVRRKEYVMSVVQMIIGLRPARTILTCVCMRTTAVPLISLLVILYRDEGCRVARNTAMLMGNGSHANIHGVGTIDLKFTSGKTIYLTKCIVIKEYTRAGAYNINDVPRMSIRRRRPYHFTTRSPCIVSHQVIETISHCHSPPKWHIKFLVPAPPLQPFHRTGSS